MTSTLDGLTATAVAHGWTADERRAASPVARASRFSHAEYPAVAIEVFELAVRPHFTARLLVNNRERAVLRRQGQVEALLADPTIAEAAAAPLHLL